MRMNDRNMEKLLRAAPIAEPPDGLQSRLVEQSRLCLANLPRSTAQDKWCDFMRVPSLGRMATVATLCIVVLSTIGITAPILFKRFMVKQFVSYEGNQVGKAREVKPGIYEATLANGEVKTYTGDPTLADGGTWCMGGEVGIDAASEKAAQQALNEFKQLYNEGKAREVRPGVYEATLANGETRIFTGDPNLAENATTSQTLKQMQAQMGEIARMHAEGRYESFYYPEAGEINAQNGLGNNERPVQWRFILSSGNVVMTGSSEPMEKNAAAFAEIELLRQHGQFKKVYRPNPWLLQLGTITYDAIDLINPSAGMPFRYFETTFLLANGKLITIAEKEPKEQCDKEFAEINSLRKDGKYEIKYLPEYDIAVKGVKQRYAELTYTLKSGEIFTVVEYEPEAK